jgi:hypothetical protein
VHCSTIRRGVVAVPCTLSTRRERSISSSEWNDRVVFRAELLVFFQRFCLGFLRLWFELGVVHVIRNESPRLKGSSEHHKTQG